MNKLHSFLGFCSLFNLNIYLHDGSSINGITAIIVLIGLLIETFR